MLELVDDETGEIVDIELFEQLQLTKEEKLENMALWYKNLLSDAAQYKIEKDLFAEREKKAKNKAEKLKAYLDQYLNGDKFNTTKVKISYRKSEKIVIDDIDLIQEEYIKIIREADKTAIKEAITGGHEITGAHLEQSNNIQIK